MEATTATAPGLTQPDRSVSRVVILAWVAVIVAVLVLLIDQQIKRQIVAEAERVRGLMAEFSKLVREADRGAKQAGEATASPGDSEHAGDGVDDAAGTSAEPGGYAGNGLGEAPGRVARPFGGSPGDG